MRLFILYLKEKQKKKKNNSVTSFIKARNVGRGEGGFPSEFIYLSRSGVMMLDTEYNVVFSSFLAFLNSLNAPACA